MTISARIIADSISSTGQRLTTFELEYPRFIHAEFMTHRLFSRNAASSRAIPVKTAIKLIEDDTARPIHWGKNQPGMSAKEECTALVSGHQYTRESWWNLARDAAIRFASKFDEAGYHKQIVNRLLEPFSHIKVVCTATEFANAFYLRCHPDAQPEINRLFEIMWELYSTNEPQFLNPGEWHVPYYDGNYGNGVWKPSGYVRMIDGVAHDTDHKKGNTLQEALMISSSQCAQVSYRKADDSLEKATMIYGRLVESEPVHASPFEHQGTPMVAPNVYAVRDWVNEKLEETNPGMTHCDIRGDYWSGNFKGFIQHRQLIPNNVKWEYSRD